MFRMPMNEKTSRFKQFLQRWLVTTLAVLVAVETLPGLHFQAGDLWSPFVTSLVLGVLNAFIRPILMLLALPLLIVTLGLFTLVINALLLWLVGQSSFFQVDSFGSAFLGALVISVVSVALNILTGTGNARVTVRRGPPPPKRNDDDGPVIDV
jgi:putative membrane protein